MRRCLVAVLTCLALAFGVTASAAPPVGVPSRAALPKSWQPWADASWSTSEARGARRAVKVGIDEVIRLYRQRPNAARRLGDDSVGSLIEVTYASKNPSSLDATARTAARRNLTILIEPYRHRRSAKCNEYEELLPIAIYSGASSSHVRTAGAAKIAALANDAYRRCGSLAKAMGSDYTSILRNRNADPNAVFDLVIWSLAFIEAELVPGLQVTPDQREFSPALWRYLRTYPLRDARTYKDGAFNQHFIDMAYLATHIAYIPTGNHRHRLYVQDSPRLYRYLRENFYAVLQMGELDLVGEFLDTFRQYGCNERNDVQTRDGTRYLLEVFHAGGDRWMAYREPGQTEPIHSYDAVHKAWEGIAGVRDRTIEPVRTGTYGAVVRRWLPAPR